jgi:hypothetical protein
MPDGRPASKAKKPDANAVLDGLKDFQRATVEYVFERLYGKHDPVRRFLVADEVGLGKTMVARGVVAKAVEHLWETIPRIDIVYICSNADIARQNINRLTLPSVEAKPIPSRITLLPRTVTSLDKKLNFISITPGTSFSLRSSAGTAEERALIYRLLDEAWEFRGVGPRKVFAGWSGFESFAKSVERMRGERLDGGLSRKFVRAANKRRALRRRLEKLADELRWVRRSERVPPRLRKARDELIGEFRRLMAEVCLDALEPDIVILDEFQRFKHLIAPEETGVAALDEMRDLAQQFMGYKDARVLLLSATPYKMYTLPEEATGDDHYADFRQTLGFLLDDEVETAKCVALLGEYGRRLLSVPESGAGPLEPLRRDLRERLLKVMVRTERLAVSDDRNGMLRTEPCCDLELMPRDLLDYVGLQGVAATLRQPDMIEYWKSAPYLLNFMETYKVKEDFTNACRDPRQCDELSGMLAGRRELLIDWAAVEKYGEVDPANPRMRSLGADVPGDMLWLPPSLPYYEVGGPFAEAGRQGVTKRLIFSSWAVVPKAIAALVSYAAERRIMLSLDGQAENTPKARQRRSALLQFARSTDRATGVTRLTGMPLFTLMYPSTTLAEVVDPLVIGSGRPVEAVLAEVKSQIDELLDSLPKMEGGDEPPDERWYWAAPLMLDLARSPESTHAWVFDEARKRPWAEGGAGGESGDDEGQDDGDGPQLDGSAFAEHVDQWQSVGLAAGEGSVALGRRPDDLAEVLAIATLAAPGVVALRALARACRSADALCDPGVRSAAAGIAWSFRSFFNSPEAMAAIRGHYAARAEDGPYWELVLHYCLDGCLQAVMDEYVHILRESLGLVDESPQEVAREIASVVHDVLSLRAASLRADAPEVEAGSGLVKMQPKRLRAHYALRFGDERSDSGQVVTRAASVREAFNSPFWPFVLATTSLGQEGLDFHCYCHAVIHWNLPSNPVDLEQREGRVHRYKGHAVRKNVAAKYGLAGVREEMAGSEGSAAGRNGSEASAGGGPGGLPDPWELLFERARSDRDAAANDLIPYWVYPLKDGAHIERYVPALPLSRDQARLEALVRSLVVYRAAIGQPRQQDLVDFLLARLPEDEVREVVDALRLDLSPPVSHGLAGAKVSGG